MFLCHASCPRCLDKTEPRNVQGALRLLEYPKQSGSDPNLFVRQRLALQRHVHPIDHFAAGLVT